MKKVIIWDHDGTIVGSVDPNDPTRRIMPNVAKVMNSKDTFNIICSGCKTASSELQDFDPDLIIAHFTQLMNQLSLHAAVFSPARGGTECWVMIKREDNNIEVRKAHEDPQYSPFIGQFKKPGIGMFVVIRDLLEELHSLKMSAENSVMIGDAWHDMVATYDVGLPFIHAKSIHGMCEETEYSELVQSGQKQSGCC